MSSSANNMEKGHPMLIIVMGASGCGKSTLGQALAKSLGIQFLDGDDLHLVANINKMASGHPLTDEDRYPWLEIIRSKAEQVCADQQLQQQDYSVNSTQPKRYGIVIACSALKQVYRDILRGKKSISQVSQQLETSNPGTLPTYFVYLKGSRECLLQRMKMRKGHFMKSNMLDSQLETLESPEGEEGVVVVRVEDTTEEQVRSASEGLSNFVAP